jgi:2-polyprenyl-3-methyl-5-hydroxy-6-metoxy-1,4-benzoquinol methylase
MRLHTHEQLLAALDAVVARSSRGDRSAPAAAGFWTDLLTRANHPLATDLPDENLLDWHDRGLLGDLRGKRVLDVGCGRGRNTRWFADHGALVDGIDIARELLDRSRPAMPAPATLTVCDILREKPPHGAYDVVYDSGCFHHLAPHRRETYLHRVLPLIAPAGVFGIVTLAADKIDSPQDIDILVSGDVGGGIGYSPEDLLGIFSVLEPVEARAVRPDVPGAFGTDFLNAALLRGTTPAQRPEQ